MTKLTIDFEAKEDFEQIQTVQDEADKTVFDTVTNLINAELKGTEQWAEITYKAMIYEGNYVVSREKKLAGNNLTDLVLKTKKRELVIYFLTGVLNTIRFFKIKS